MSAPKFFRTLLDFCFPPRCPLCNVLISSEQCVCEKCDDLLFALDAIQATKVENARFCGDCTAPFLYEDRVRRLLLDFKFRGRVQYGAFFGAKMAQALALRGVADKFDLVTCVPISRRRMRERGYDQAEVLARKTAQLLGLRYVSCLMKVGENQVQHKLNIIERSGNVKNMYKVLNKNLIFGKKIVLIDDIVTTGSTMAECGAVLMEGGASDVICGAVAFRALEKEKKTAPIFDF